MTPARRAELFKQRSTRTTLGLFAAMVGLVLFVVLLHGLGLAAENLGTHSKQLTVLFGWGGVFRPMIAGLMGAMSINAEIRYGTIRPTLLVNPVRRQVLEAKTWTSVLTGLAFGLVAGVLVAGVGTAALNSRGIEVHLGGGDYARVIAGTAVASAMWGAIGVGVGALVRSQVPALVGLVVWLLFIENLLVGGVAGVGAVGRYLPGAAAKSISGQQGQSLLSAAAGTVVLVLYVVAAGLSGVTAIDSHDFS